MSSCHALMWTPDVAAWSHRFRVYAVDVIGEPGLSAPVRPPLASGAYPLWFGDVLDAVGVARAAVVAVSLGAGRRSTSPPGARSAWSGWRCSPVGVAATKVTGLMGAVLLRPEVRRQGSAELVRLLVRHYRCRRDTVPLVEDDALRRTTMPLLAVLGGRDAFIDAPRTAERLSRLVPSATVRVLLPGIGHLLPAQTAPVPAFLTAP